MDVQPTTMKKLHFSFVLFLLLSVVACERGCTTERILDSDSKDFTVNGENITVGVRLIDSRNSRAIDGNIFHREVTHSFSVNLDVYYRGQQIRDVFLEGVDEPDGVDLNAVLKRVSLALSKDGNHLAVGVDKKISEVLHFYKDQPIRNMAIMSMNPPEGTPWSQLKIEEFPAPRELILNSMLENCDFFIGEDELIQTFMDDVAPTDTAHRILLSNWPQCAVAMDYYTEPTVRRLSTNKTWKRWAERRSLVVIKNDILPANFTGSDEFYAALNSSNVLEIQDSAIVAKWGGTGDQRMNDLLLKRLHSGNKSMAGEKRKTVYNQAKEGVASFLRTGESDYRHETIHCLRVLSVMGDTTEAYKVIHYALGENLEKVNSFDLIEVIYENYQFYTPCQRQFIRSKTEEVFARIDNYARSVLFRAAIPIVDCRQLRRWKKNYPDDLSYESLPAGC